MRVYINHAYLSIEYDVQIFWVYLYILAEFILDIDFAGFRRNLIRRNEVNIYFVL